ncbi:hypothetical protein N4297_14135, partial [Staphylococcus aureus]|nr:hypothetical protein [Staphylococcus aureus]
ESRAWLEQRQSPAARASRFHIGELRSPPLLRITILGTTASALTLSIYWGATTWIPTFLMNDRGLDVRAMTGYIVWMNAGMFVGYNLFGIVADHI